MVHLQFKTLDDISEELWINMSEFHPKVKEIKKDMLEHAKKLEYDCVLYSNNGRVICKILNTDYFLQVFGYGSKFTIAINRGKEVIVDVFVEFEELVDQLFEKTLREMFWLLTERLEYDKRRS